MNRKNNTLNALFMSVVSLILCMSMFVGTTFAWFTDSVESGVNQIAAGNLDVELYHSKTTTFDPEKDTVDANTKLFTDKDGNEIEKWEPGVVAYTNLKVANVGTLALKYQLSVNCTNMNYVERDDVKYSLADALQVAVVEGGFTGATREDAQKLAEDGKMEALESFVLSGELEGDETSKTYGIVIYWEPGENDNRFNLNNGKETTDGEKELKIDLGVNLFATQEMYEKDSFGDDYDMAASTVNGDGSASLTVETAPSAIIKKTTVKAPAGAFAPGSDVEIKVDPNNSLFNVTSDNGTVASVDVVLLVNGEEISEELPEGMIYTVETYIPKGLTNVRVFYGEVEHNVIEYNAETGLLSFTTNHFSEYIVKAGKAVAYNEDTDTAYTTAEDVVKAVQGGADISDVNIADSEKHAVVDAAANAGLSTKDMNALEDGLAAAKGSWSSSPYLTLKDAFDAASGNVTITLLDDVAVNELITNRKGNNVTLNLNGKTITGTDTTTKNFSLIDNRGKLTITGNGKMTLTATVNSGWSRYSAVIANNPGGKLIIENGTLEHLGGTDMAYGIDNLTNGKGTYAETVINGGTVKSTYRGIRQFLNGIEAQNILTINGGVVEGANKSVWMQDPNMYANTGKLTVAEGATLNGDVYLFVTAGSTEWPVEVSIAAEAVNGEVKTGNVPAGYVVHEVDGYWTVVAPTTVSSADELSAALAAGCNVVLADDITLTQTLLVKKDVVINLNGYTVDANMSQNALFQSQSNAAPSMTITSSAAGAEINVSGGDTSVLLGYGSTVIKNVTINVTGCDNASPNPFNVYGDLTLGEGTVVNVDYLGTALISNNGKVAIVIDGAKINVGTFKVNGGAVISLNQASILEMKSTNIKIDNFVLSPFGGDSLVSKVDGVTIEDCTFEVTDSNGASCTFVAKDGKYRLVQN